MDAYINNIVGGNEDIQDWIFNSQFSSWEIRDLREFTVHSPNDGTARNNTETI
jgi:hypothetical protein